MAGPIIRPDYSLSNQNLMGYNFSQNLAFSKIKRTLVVGSNSSVDNNKGEISISTSTFISGIYLLTIQNNNTIWHKKLVIQH